MTFPLPDLGPGRVGPVIQAGIDTLALLKKGVPVPGADVRLKSSDVGGNYLLNEITQKAAVPYGRTEHSLSGLLLGSISNKIPKAWIQRSQTSHNQSSQSLGSDRAPLLKKVLIQSLVCPGLSLQSLMKQKASHFLLSGTTREPATISPLYFFLVKTRFEETM